MTTYEPADWRPEPGDVAAIRYNTGVEQGATEAAILGDPRGDGELWWTCDQFRVLPRYVFHARRLQVVDPASTVVLDPDNPDDVQRVNEARSKHVTTSAMLRSLLPAVTPPEPNGLGAVVLPADSSQILQLQEGGWHIVMPVGGDVPTTYKADARDRVLSHGVGCSCGAPDCNGGAS